MLFCVFSPMSGIAGSKDMLLFTLIDMQNNFRECLYQFTLSPAVYEESQCPNEITF